MGKVGRPKGHNNKELIVSMRLDESTKNRLDAYCTKMNMSKSEVIRGAVESLSLKKDAGKNQEVYAVLADTHKEGWGAELELFGVCDNIESMEKITGLVKNQGFIPEVYKIKLNKACRISLGGYYE